MATYVHVSLSGCMFTHASVCVCVGVGVGVCVCVQKRKTSRLASGSFI